MRPGDETWMRRALDLASSGRGNVEPNPMVGCVIVKEDRAIGEGFHRRFGGPHAEREALAACTQSPVGATAYVTLEPCCHLNKKTPPCVPALLEAGIVRVVAACADPNPAVSGEGFDQLRQAGVAVDTGVLESESRQLNAPFFALMRLGRPYVTLKWAQTADAKVAGPRGSRLQISSPASMQVVHDLRARCDAILVGIGTVLADDPLLTARPGAEAPAPPRPLTRVVLDSELRTPAGSRLVQTAGEHPLIIYCTRGDGSALERAGATVVRLQGERPGLQDVLADLGRRGMTHLLVEGGPAIAASFIRENLADRAWIFQSPRTLGAADAPDAPRMAMTAAAQREVGGDRLTEYVNRGGDAFFALQPSVDFRDLVQRRA